MLGKNLKFGQETSSRNSEVLHAGFYQPGSLRARLCVRGNSLIYEICNRKNIPISMLVYSVPAKLSLGKHIGLDLAHQKRIGHNAYFVDEIDYRMDETHKQEYYDFALQYIDADIKPDDLQPDQCGIRPELSSDGEFRDFIIHHEIDKGFEGLINLVGIDSPGLTASPAIAEYVSEIIKDIL